MHADLNGTMSMNYLSYSLLNLASKLTDFHLDLKLNTHSYEVQFVAYICSFLKTQLT